MLVFFAIALLDKTPSYFNAPTPRPTSQSAKFWTCRRPPTGSGSSISPRGTGSANEGISQSNCSKSVLRRRGPDVYDGLPPEVRSQDPGSSYPSSQKNYTQSRCASVVFSDRVPNDTMEASPRLNGPALSPDEIPELAPPVDSTVLGSLNQVTEWCIPRKIGCALPGDPGVRVAKFSSQDGPYRITGEDLRHRRERIIPPGGSTSSSQSRVKTTGASWGPPCRCQDWQDPPAKLNSRPVGKPTRAYQRVERGREWPPRPPESDERPSLRRSRRPVGGPRPPRP